MKLVKGICQYNYEFSFMKEIVDGSNLNHKGVRTYHMYLYREDPDLKQITKEVIKLNDTKAYHLKQFNTGIIDYGYENKENPTGHGGLWSSNPCAFYEVTGELVTEHVRIITRKGNDTIRMFMLDAMTLLPEGFTMIVNSEGSSEIVLVEDAPKAEELGYHIANVDEMSKGVTVVNVKKVAKAYKPDDVQNSKLLNFQDWQNGHSWFIRTHVENDLFASKLTNDFFYAAKTGSDVMADFDSYARVYAIATDNNEVMQAFTLRNANAVLVYKGKIQNALYCQDAPSINALVSGNKHYMWIGRSLLGFKFKGGSKLRPYTYAEGYSTTVDPDLDRKLLQD